MLIESRERKLILLSGVVLLGLALLSLAVGRVPLTLVEVFGAFKRGSLATEGATSAVVTLWQIRLPRSLLAIAVGAALGAAGCVFQLVFRNPLASPDVLGVSSGAALGAALAILAGASLVGVQAAALLGGLGLVALVVGLVRGRTDAAHLLLCGMALSSLAAAGVVALKHIADPQNQLPSITYWLMGSLVNAHLGRSLGLLGLVVVALVILLTRPSGWQALAFAEPEMRGIGYKTQTHRALAIGLATALTAVSVALAGLIGWIGLIVPHAARLLVGERWVPWLTLSTLFGALLLLGVDTLSRAVFESEWPPGVALALIGVPVFLILLRSARR